MIVLNIVIEETKEKEFECAFNILSREDKTENEEVIAKALQAFHEIAIKQLDKDSKTLWRIE